MTEKSTNPIGPAAARSISAAMHHLRWAKNYRLEGSRRKARRELELAAVHRSTAAVYLSPCHIPRTRTGSE